MKSAPFVLTYLSAIRRIAAFARATQPAQLVRIRKGEERTHPLPLPHESHRGANRCRIVRSLSISCFSENVPAEESASQGKERLMDVGPLFVAHAQAAKLIKPCESPFNHPAPLAQSTTVFSITLCKKSQNMPGAQTFSDCFCVITTVA